MAKSLPSLQFYVNFSKESLCISSLQTENFKRIFPFEFFQAFRRLKITSANIFFCKNKILKLPTKTSGYISSFFTWSDNADQSEEIAITKNAADLIQITFF